MRMRLPVMDDPLSRHWKQPEGLRDRVDLYFNHAVIADFDWYELSRYENTLPSGVYPGKVWRNRKWLCWYGRERNGCCRIVTVRALVVSHGSRNVIYGVRP